MNDSFTRKMFGISERLLSEMSAFYAECAVEAHVFGSVARGTNDALSDIDIWVTFDDDAIDQAIMERHDVYARFGEIVMNHELQHNFPLNGIQSAVLYKIEGELIRVDFYLCPFSSSRMFPGSKALFAKKLVPEGAIISETKRTPRDLSDRITFFISMCFVAIKKVARGDDEFMPFLTSEFKKFEKDFPELAHIAPEPTFETIRSALATLGGLSNAEQKCAVEEIRKWMVHVEPYL